MTLPAHTHVRLPAMRAAQLRALAEARGITMVSIIESVIHAAIEAGEISPDLPGIDLTPTPASAPRVLNLDQMQPPAGASTRSLSWMIANPDSPEAQAFAARARAGAKTYIERWRDAVAGVTIRGGRGYVIETPDGQELVLSKSLFDDLKAQVERAAKVK